MVWTKGKSLDLIRQLRDITDAVELLDRGVCQLEAKQLAILAAPYTTREMRAESNYLTAMNNSTANSIKTSLREIEEIVKTEMEGAPDSKELIQEFLKVLHNSIRVLHEYRLVQQTYVDELNKRVSISPMPRNCSKNDGIIRATNYNPLHRLTQFLRQMCKCI